MILKIKYFAKYKSFSDLTKNNLILKKTLDNIGAFDAIEIAYKSSDNPKHTTKPPEHQFDGLAHA